MSGRLRALAARRNLASVRDAEKTISRLTKTPGKALAIGAFSTRARRLLDSLKRRVEDARLFLESTEERRRDGDLDDSAAGAEGATARTLIMLCSFLEDAYREACESGDVTSMRKVRTSADMLFLFSAEHHFLSGHYPETDLRLSWTLRRVRIREARILHENIIGALGNAPKELGLEAPAFSANDS
ncbi:MAG: hypothetical protein ACXABY_23195 [Candidatus Thorarchaeota archaeon]